MAGDEQFVLRAVFEQIAVARRVGQGGSLRAGGVSPLSLDEDRIVDDPGMPIDQRFDRSQTAAIVPAAGVRSGQENGERDGADHEQDLCESLSPTSRVDRIRHRILPDLVPRP
jgi:hypothetical protein